jgi:hypothetical protein
MGAVAPKECSLCPTVHLKTSTTDACTQILLYISYVHVFISIINYMDIMLGTLEEYKPHDRDSIRLENTFYGAQMEQNIHCMKSLSTVFVMGALLCRNLESAVNCTSRRFYEII